MQLIFLLLLHLSNAYYFEHSAHEQWQRSCGRTHGEYIHWYVALKNNDVQRTDGAVVITPKHVLATRFTVSNQHGKPTSPENLKVIVHNNGEPVKIPNRDHVKKGIARFRIEKDPEFPVLHVTIPTSSEYPQDNVFSLAIVELEEELHNKVAFACLTMADYPEQLLPHGAELTVVYEDSSNKRTTREIVYNSPYRECKEYACEIRLEAKPYTPKTSVGNAWYKVIYGQEVLYGLDLGDGTAISIPFWSDFLCKQLGTCTLGYNLQSDEKHSDFAVFVDGVYHPYNKILSCQNDYRAALIREASPFTRLTRLEQRVIKSKCGEVNDNDEPYTFLVTLVSEQEDKSLIKCAGVLITPMHVLSSLSCVKSATYESEQLAVLFADHPQADDEQFPFDQEDFLSSQYDPSTVGKRWIRATRFVYPHGNMYTDDYDHDLALIELQVKIPIESYIKPICLSQNVLSRPEFNFVRIRETNKDGGYFKRNIVDVRFATHDTIGFANCTTDPESCWAFRFRKGSELGKEERGGALIEKESIGDSKKLMLIGIASSSAAFNEGGYLATALRTQFFSTFICIHTGLCADGETFTRRLYTNFDTSNFRLPVDVVRDEWNKHKEMNKNNLQWEQFESEIKGVTDALAKQLPYYYFEQGNAEIQAECGKQTSSQRMRGGTNFTIADHPWPIFIRRNNDHSCTGAFISPRHVITARHCIIAHLKGGNRHFTIAFGDVNYLEHKKIDISPMQFLCLPKRGESVTDHALFDPLIYMYGGGRRDGASSGLIQYLTVDSSDSRAIIEERSGRTASYYFSYRDFEKRPMSAPGDSGGPIVRRRTSNGRFVLVGVVRGHTDTGAEGRTRYGLITGMHYFIDDICKFTGICPDGGYRSENLHEMELNGATVCA